VQIKNALIKLKFSNFKREDKKKSKMNTILSKAWGKDGKAV
jgi:hypothetical protein